jgi:ABC-type branched-subunit amino acid transport system substrate-binding protein
VTTRRAFLRRAAGGLPLLAAPRAVAAYVDAATATHRVALITARAASEDAVRGARLAAGEAARTAKLLGRSFELIELHADTEDGTRAAAARAHAASCEAIVAALVEPARSALLAAAAPGLPVLDGTAGDPANGRCAGGFFTGVSTAEALRVLEMAGVIGAGDGDRALVPRHDGALALHRADGIAGDTVCVAAWHPTLFRYGATQLNERFRRAYDAGMSSAAWAAWIAVKLVADVALRAPAGGTTLMEGLADPTARFDGHKGTPLSFRRSDRWLRQPLYVVHCDGPSNETHEVAYDDTGARTACAEGSSP